MSEAAAELERMAPNGASGSAADPATATLGPERRKLSDGVCVVVVVAAWCCTVAVSKYQ